MMPLHSGAWDQGDRPEGGCDREDGKRPHLQRAR